MTLLSPWLSFPVCRLWHPSVSHLTLFLFIYLFLSLLLFSTQFTSHFVLCILCSMFHNNSLPLSFIIPSSLSPPHPVSLSLPRLFLSNSSSCPPPSQLPAALRIATAAATAASISTRLLPTDSQAGLCRRGPETNSRDLCHSAKILGKHLEGNKAASIPRRCFGPLASGK